MDLPGCSENDGSEDRLYDYLMDSGVLNDVRTMAESMVGSSATSTADSDGADARRIADRLLEQNADDVERALDAILRDAELGSEVRLVDRRWLELLDFGPGRPARKTLRNLNALARLPFTYDTYAGAYFRRLTGALERTVTVDPFFDLTVCVYAKLVDSAPDCESAAESFGSLCEAAHLRCLRPDFGKAVTSVCLVLRCLETVCRRGAGSKNVKPAVVEFAAAMSANPTGDRCPYAILCCARPTAAWFDHVSKYRASRTAFFECLDGDRRLLRTVVSGFLAWMAEPAIPGPSERNGTAAVRYARFLHAAHLLAKMFAYRSARDAFPVKAPGGATRVCPVGLANRCLGFLAANGSGLPVTLADGLCGLVAAVAAFRGAVVDAVADAGTEYGARILAEVARRPDGPAALAERRDAVDGLFDGRRRRRGYRDVDSLIDVATALCKRHESVWLMVTRRASFLEAVAATAATAADDRGRSLLTDIRCTPLGALTYDLRDDCPRRDPVDWLDPRERLSFGVSCAVDEGVRWLSRVGAFRSLDQFVGRLLISLETSLLDSNDADKSIDSVVDVAYAYCATVDGLRILLGDRDADERPKLAEIYYLSYENFDGHPISRDVLVTLWLRLIEAATHTFASRVYVDSKLKYQDILSKLLAENRTEDGTVIVDETTELLTKLQRPLLSADSSYSSASTETSTSVLTEFLTNAENNCHISVWLKRVQAITIRSEQISGNETIDLITSFGRRRFDGTLDPDQFDRKSNATDFDDTGIRLALRYGSSTGMLAEDSAAASGLRRFYGGVERRGSFDCTTCTLFVAARGRENRCVEARAVLTKLEDSIWATTADGDAYKRAAFGHLVEELLQRELPEVYNAFKMSGISWWLLCSGWSSDCFWGRLGWPEVCRWLCLMVAFPVDYRAFFFTCIAMTQKRRWLEAFNRGRFRDTVYQCDFGDFRLADHADYLEDLAKKYPRTISKRLSSEFDTN